MFQKGRMYTGNKEDSPYEPCIGREFLGLNNVTALYAWNENVPGDIFLGGWGFYEEYSAVMRNLLYNCVF
jgi:hypothetical protein